MADWCLREQPLGRAIGYWVVYVVGMVGVLVTVIGIFGLPWPVDCPAGKTRSDCVQEFLGFGVVVIGAYIVGIVVMSLPMLPVAVLVGLQGSISHPGRVVAAWICIVPLLLLTLGLIWAALTGATDHCNPKTVISISCWLNGFIASTAITPVSIAVCLIINAILSECGSQRRGTADILIIESKN